MHRDIKPDSDNILLCPTDHGLIDFDLSRQYRGKPMHEVGLNLGPDENSVTQERDDGVGHRTS